MDKAAIDWDALKETVAAVQETLDGHRVDTMNQDSGTHCECGSDSRFTQWGGNDPPWRTIDEHRAQQAVRTLVEHARAAM